jgi:hypothetical protein
VGTGESAAAAAARDTREEEARLFADVVREVLLLPFAPTERRRSVVAATRMSRAAAPIILGALDAARASAGRGEPRSNVVSAYVRALSRATGDDGRQPAADPPGPDLQQEVIGPDAFLLAQAAAEYEARAHEAAGIDAEEEERCRTMAEGLRVLSSRHEVWFVGRDASAPPDRKPQRARGRRR